MDSTPDHVTIKVGRNIQCSRAGAKEEIIYAFDYYPTP